MASSSSSKPKKSSKGSTSRDTAPLDHDAVLGSFNTGQWTSLPFNIGINIMQRLGNDFKAAVRLGATSQFWRLIYASDELWQYHLLRKFLHLESCDEFFLERDAVRYGSLLGASSSLQLFARKWVQWQAWSRGGISMDDTAIPRCGSNDDQYTHLIRWRDFFISTLPDGRVIFWNPERFAPEATFDINIRDMAIECKPVRIEYPHASPIYCYCLRGDKLFTASKEGTLSVMLLEYISIRDITLLGLETTTLIEGQSPIITVDVSLAERIAVVGTLAGEISAYEWDETEWTRWRLVRKLNFGPGLCELCLLPRRRFAASGSKDIEIFNIDAASSTSHRGAGANSPNPSGDTAASSATPSDLKTTPDLVIPSYLIANPSLKASFEISMTPKPKPRPIDQQPPTVTRNLKLIDGLLVVSISTLGIEAWDVDRVELKWKTVIRSLDIRHMQRFNHKLALMGIDESQHESALVIDLADPEQVRWEASSYKPIYGVSSICVTDDAFYLCSQPTLCHHKVKGSRSIDKLFPLLPPSEKKRKGACAIS